MPKPARLCFVLALLLLWCSPGNAQMMGGHMGEMMRDGQMHRMGELMAWMHGADLDQQPTTPEPQNDAQTHLLGQRLYGAHCKVCHGAKGDGKGPQAVSLSPPPRDLTTGIYEFRSTPSGSLPTDQDIWKVISNGLHGTAMVPWPTLSESDRWALVTYLKGFSSRFAAEGPAVPVTVTAAPPPSSALIRLGRKLYIEVGCQECHGMQGRGDGPSASKLSDSRGRSFRPTDFVVGPLKRGSSMRDTYLTLRTGLNGTPMLSAANALTPEQTWALAAYIQSLASLPTYAARSNTMERMGRMMGITANSQEQRGMMIDMPGMAGMRIGR
jgi:mono/diheme cytochrome c family protein